MKQSDKELPTYDAFVAITGQKIMDLRMKNQYTRKYLADLADISEKYLYEIEMGKKGCSGYILYRLAKSLDISLDYLVGNDLVRYENLQEMMESLRGYQKEMMGTIMQTVFDSFQKIW